jgi:protease-4
MAVEERVISAVRIARANPMVRGVVLHVNSPGGSALASDRMHHELVQLAKEKPLVACFSDVAASGGYYIAAAAHEIVAQPTSITGSIGVISARLVLAPLLEKLSVHVDVLQRGARARLLQPTLPLDEDDQRALDREIGAMYRSFVGVVAEGRKRPREEIEAVAQGRVWTGAEAHARGLVDKLGGLDVAVEAVRTRVGRGAAKLRVGVLRSPRKMFPPLDPPRPREGAEGAMAARELVSAVAASMGVDADAVALALSGERVLAWSDLASSIRSA